METIHKIIAIVIKNDKFLLVRKQDKDVWTSLGGRPEEGETEEETLLREIKEEVDSEAKIIRKLGDFVNKASFDDALVKLSAYLVKLERDLGERGDISHIDPELAEYMFFSSDYEKKGYKVTASIKEQLIPFCIKQDLLRWR